MPFVVKDMSTGRYWTSSHAKGVDHTNVVYAKVYAKKGTAKGVATGLQDANMHHYETEQYWLSQAGETPEWFTPQFHGVPPDWQVEEI